MKSLSTPQREAIRAIHDGDLSVPSRTLNSLKRAGIVTYCPVLDLTAYGERCYESIMRSGDGPERLKAMLRF